MSSPALASYQRSAGLLSQGSDDLGADFLDQFLTYSPVDNSEDDTCGLPESTSLDFSSSNNLCASGSLSSHEVEAKHSLMRAPWESEPWAAINDSASLDHSAQGNDFYAEESGRAAISDSELLSLAGINLQPPQVDTYAHLSLPPSPSPAAAALSKRRTRMIDSLSKTFRKATSSVDKSLRSPIRKTCPSPKMMHNSNHSQNALDLWGQKLALGASKFDFEFQLQMGPLSPSASNTISNSSDTSSTMRVASDDLQPPFTRSKDYDTPLSTPILDTQHSRNTSSHQIPLEDLLFPATPQSRNVTAAWSQLSGSTELSPYHNLNLYTDDGNASAWWNYAAAEPMAQPSPTVFHTNPQLATKSLVNQLHNDLVYEGNELACDPSSISSGLMIQMPGRVAQQSCIVACSTTQQRGYFAAAQSQPQYHNASRQYARASPRQLQSTTPTRKDHSASSASESGSPISSTSPTFHIQKRKTQKVSKSSTPRTPSLGGAVDFVNYTPNDSRKILTGVAPSGSSKTKAKREKEAMEKRRRLSQAAVRAVRAAGGDVESLVEQGLLV